ncbi:MAG: pyruvate formate lyase family protein [Anaerolineaceae bacterium]|nr:pyruvate formate lyase family protein [Anaerolineaceae bacterium]
METALKSEPKFAIKTEKNLSPRIKWLRDFYYKGLDRPWNNEFTAWTTGTPWDTQYEEITYYVVPESYPFLPTFKASFRQTARPVKLDEDFWKKSIVERRAWFLKEVMTKYLPAEFFPGDLIAGARFNVLTSACYNQAEAKEYEKQILGKNGLRAATFWFHNHGYGNVGATSGHIIPDYAHVLKVGWKGISAEIQNALNALGKDEEHTAQRNQLKAMLTAASLPDALAKRYSDLCTELASREKELARREELMQLADILRRVLWEPPQTFWEALQSLWITHMLVMSDENYPGPGISFGRLDQYLLPYWESSLQAGMGREFGKEIMKCFWVHANTAYDAMIRVGSNQGITAGYGQLFNLSGMGKDGKDMTNDLTYAMLEVIDEMSPILEPKPNVRLHRNSPEPLLDKVVQMVSDSQGAPFLLNFDERSMAGMLREAKEAKVEDLINEANVHEYASVGCLENTMVGNDRSGTVDNNLNLLKAVELALMNGFDMIPFTDPMSGKTEKPQRFGPQTGDSTTFTSWKQFWQAYVSQTQYIIQRIVDLYERSEALRAKFNPTPYLSCLVKGCIAKGKDVTQGGAELNFTTIEAVTFATTVDSLLAIKYLVFDKKLCIMQELIQALQDNWVGHSILRAHALNKAPKYGRDEDAADQMAHKVMENWTTETWKHRTQSTSRQFRPGMLSWNYWVAESFVLPASADGRPRGKFLSNAICPTSGADVNGPTANANSVGKALGGKANDGKGDFKGYLNALPNGASHTMTFSPALLRDPEHQTKFKSFLKGYIENGGTALQINILDADMLRDAQRNPENYKHLLVRVTGYNAYFTSIGKELQDEIIARESHCM